MWLGDSHSRVAEWSKPASLGPAEERRSQPKLQDRRMNDHGRHWSCFDYLLQRILLHERIICERIVGEQTLR